MNESFSKYVRSYENTAEGNDQVWNTFTSLTDEISFLKEHRDFIEENKLGFGDRAFHFMWYLLFEEAKPGHVLEIGVYKGQVISLWSLICKKLGLKVQVDAISPFSGNVSSSINKNKFLNSIKRKFSAKYRQQESVGNFYEKMDYLEIIASVFQKFDIPFSEVNKIQGFSTDPQVIGQVAENHYDLIYVDGDHSYEVVVKDLKNYHGLIKEKGYLVMDDASCYLPGSAFWKGHEEVSRATKIIPDLGFENILNVGHNRIYQKIS